MNITRWDVYQPGHNIDSELLYISRRGGTVLLFSGHQYTLKRTCKSGAAVWTCNKRRDRKCPGTVCINNERVLYLKEHACSPDFVQNEIDRIFDECKRRLLSDDPASVSAVYNAALRTIKDSGLHLLGEVPTLNSLRKILYRNKLSCES